MQYVKGDICDTHLEDIIHGCNALGVMGSGVALAIRNRFPGCYENYARQIYDVTGGTDTWKALGIDFVHFIPGSVTGQGKPVRIHNLVTQENAGHNPNIRYATYYHVIVGLTNIIHGKPSRHGRVSNEFAIPKIGCGLGGLKWDIMEVLLTEIEDHTGARFTVYDI